MKLDFSKLNNLVGIAGDAPEPPAQSKEPEQRLETKSTPFTGDYSDPIKEEPEPESDRAEQEEEQKQETLEDEEAARAWVEAALGGCRYKLDEAAKAGRMTFRSLAETLRQYPHLRPCGRNRWWWIERTNCAMCSSTD